ncbi:MAG TPA: sigma factor-like helix-turn-helix DNA-binding protein [Tepidisphaeraceae bacterium]|jgi:RNA polymerase sigma factor (sigma-70 family)
MTDVADADLLRNYLSGDAQAFSVLVSRHDSWIFEAARRRLRDDHLADDARQAVFLLLTDKATRLVQAGVPSIAAWLFHALHFTCSNITRTRTRQSRHDALAGTFFRGQKTSADDTLITMLEDTIAQLPPRDREAVVRRYYQCESFADVGRALDITAEAARKRVGRVIAQIRASMAAEGVQTKPEALMGTTGPSSERPPRSFASDPGNIRSIVKGTAAMIQQMEAIQFAVMTAEFYVRSIDDHLDFFEKLGFRRHFVEEPDANGIIQRAAMRGGHARIWMRRATPDHPPAPGVSVYVWLDGGEESVVGHREAVIAQGIVPNQLFYDGALMNFTVTTPDGYVIGFFSTYKPHTFDLKTDG